MATAAVLTVDYDRLGAGDALRLLDLGAGSGRHTHEGVRRGCRVVAFDLNLADLRALDNDDRQPTSPAAHAVGGDATTLPFDNDSFDVVIASEVLEHVGDDRAAVAELARVLRPGGTIAVSVPAQLSEQVCWWLSSDYHAPAVPGGHVRIYSRRQLSRLLTDNGLRLTHTHGAHGLHTPYWWLKCIFGPNAEPNAAVRAYHALLVREMTRRGPALAAISRLLDVVAPKSLVVYGTKREV